MNDLDWLARNVHLAPEGAMSGFVSTSGPIVWLNYYDDRNSKAYRMDQILTRRVELGLDDSTCEEQVEWNGEGLPPVGSVCEAYLEGVWITCEVLKHGSESQITGAAAVRDISDNRLYWLADFRPIQSEEDRAVEEMLSFVDNGLYVADNPEAVCRKLYKAGYRKQEVNGE